MIIENSTIFDWLENNVDKYPELHAGFARGTKGVDESVLLQLMTRLDWYENLLNVRDNFIVENDLWIKFTKSLEND